MSRNSSTIDLDALLSRLERDPSACYNFSLDEIRAVMGEIGETEALIDALLTAEGQSIEARAEAIGVRVSDFCY
jgi:hypothetical protein